MAVRPLEPHEKELYNKIVRHPLQSWEWGEFRKEMGLKVVRLGMFSGEKLVQGFQLTFHPIPHTPWTVGYLPKGPLPTEEMIHALQEVGKKHNTIFIQLEPNVLSNFKFQISNFKFLKLSARPLFTKYTFHLDLTKPEEELMSQMSSKTRYNVRLAQKRGVTVQEENTESAFKRYLELTEETTKRQGFYAHSPAYHKKMWTSFSHQLTTDNSQLTTHLLTARFQGKILTTWVVFLFNDVLYYPYGASTSEYKEVMASNLMMWETMKWGKQKRATLFDLWGTPGLDPKPSDPYFGFHRFKMGYGPKLVEFVGSYDLVLKQPHYQFFTLADKLRWILLKWKTKLV